MLPVVLLAEVFIAVNNLIGDFWIMVYQRDRVTADPRCYCDKGEWRVLFWRDY